MKFRVHGVEVSVNVPDRAAFDRCVRKRLQTRTGFALATINLDHMVKLRTSKSFREVYAKHDLVTADGNPIVWLSHIAGDPVSLVQGSEAILPACRIAVEEGVPVALFGTTPEALENAAKQIKSIEPDLQIALAISPEYGFDPTSEDAADMARQIEESGAGLCFTALGSPKGEAFNAFARTYAPSVGFMGIGAGLDFFAGTQRRAPQLVQRMALEWLWRGVSQPRRLGPRYIRCAVILPSLMLRAARQRFSPA